MRYRRFRSRSRFSKRRYGRSFRRGRRVWSVPRKVSSRKIGRRI